MNNTRKYHHNHTFVQFAFPLNTLAASSLDSHTEHGETSVNFIDESLDIPDDVSGLLDDVFFSFAPFSRTSGCCCFMPFCFSGCSVASLVFVLPGFALVTPFVAAALADRDFSVNRKFASLIFFSG